MPAFHVNMILQMLNEASRAAGHSRVQVPIECSIVISQISPSSKPPQQQQLNSITHILIWLFVVRWPTTLLHLGFHEADFQESLK